MSVSVIQDGQVQLVKRISTNVLANLARTMANVSIRLMDTLAPVNQVIQANSVNTLSMTVPPNLVKTEGPA